MGIVRILPKTPRKKFRKPKEKRLGSFLKAVIVLAIVTLIVMYYNQKQ